MWIRIDIWLTLSRLSPGKTWEKEWKKSMSYIKKIIEQVKPKQYFHLFEPDPTLFLAMNIGNDDLGKVKTAIKKSKIKLVKKTLIKEDTKDNAEGEQAVRFFQASTDYAIWKATSEEYKEGYDNMDETKLLHCFFNAIGLTGSQELQK